MLGDAAITQQRLEVKQVQDGEIGCLNQRELARRIQRDGQLPLQLGLRHLLQRGNVFGQRDRHEAILTTGSGLVKRLNSSGV